MNYNLRNNNGLPGVPTSYETERKNYPNDPSFHNYDGTEDNYSIDIGLRYGDMPSEMLMQKFDETNIDSDTYQPLENLNDHWRSTLTDLSAQPTSLESDYRRTETNSTAFLNWRHRGTYTNSDAEVHQPEMFLGFHGEEDREERGGCKGTNPLEPDFKEFTKQNQARLKYLRFTPDASLNVTGLGRSEAKAQADNQKIFRTLRHQLNWFDTSYDGRRNGIAMNGGLNPESIVYQQVTLDKTDEDYNDMIKQAQTNHTNKTTILSNKLFRNSTAYNQFTTDHVFKVAAYGENPRRFRPYFPLESVVMNVDTENELAYPEEQVDKMKGKAMNLLMGKIIMQRHKAAQDITNGESQSTVVRKTKAQEKEIKSIIGNLATDADSKESMINNGNDRGKTVRLSPHVSNVDKLVEDQDKKQSIATMMYKTVTGSADHIKTKSMIVNDQSESSSLMGTNDRKTSKYTRAKGGKSREDVITMTDSGVSLNTNRFKSAARRMLESNVDRVSRDGTIAPTFNQNGYSKSAVKIKNNSRAVDVVTQDGYNELVKDSIRPRTNGGSGKIGERGNNSSIVKTERDNFATMEDF